MGHITFKTGEEKQRARNSCTVAKCLPVGWEGTHAIPPTLYFQGFVCTKSSELRQASYLFEVHLFDNQSS